MLTTRICGLAAIVAAFMAVSFVATTESKASTLNTTFDYSGSMQANAPARAAARQNNRQNANPVQRTAYQQPAQQTQATYRAVHAGGYTITKSLLNELAVTHPNLHARLVAAGSRNAAATVTSAEAKLIQAMAVKTQHEIKAAGSEATTVAVTIVFILIDVWVRMSDPDYKTFFGQIWRPISCVILSLFPVDDTTKKRACASGSK